MPQQYPQLHAAILSMSNAACQVINTFQLMILMHGHLVGQNCRGRPNTAWNDVVLFDTHKLKLNRYTRDALNKPVWRELTCVART